MEEKRKEDPKAREPKLAVGRQVWYFDPRLHVGANDGIGQGPYPATIMKITPADGPHPVRLHLRVAKWGNDAYHSFVVDKAHVQSDTHYWQWPDQV